MPLGKHGPGATWQLAPIHHLVPSQTRDTVLPTVGGGAGDEASVTTSGCAGGNDGALLGLFMTMV